MAQEGDTLGKDSELAATLAQGKPVIVYVPKIEDNELETHANKLKGRPLSYFRLRLMTLLAEGFFGKPDNMSKVINKAEGLGINPNHIKQGMIVNELLQLFNKFEDDRKFAIISEEENWFRGTHDRQIDLAARLLAAVESVAADNRADTIKAKHPLSLQVHLATGVANGVLVSRSAKECAELIRHVLLRNMKFDIELLKAKAGKVLGTVLREKSTRSLFRVVTENECLTNSFWNFYLEEEENHEEQGGSNEPEARGH